jgi:hypothetical protein
MVTKLGSEESLSPSEEGRENSEAGKHVPGPVDSGLDRGLEERQGQDLELPWVSS